MSHPPIIVGHLAPDLDCLGAIWILKRFGPYQHAALTFVPAGTTLEGRPADLDPHVIHVDTGGGRFDHHGSTDASICAMELVRREFAADDLPLRQLSEAVCRLDHAVSSPGELAQLFLITDLVRGLNALYRDDPRRIAELMSYNFDAWYEQKRRELSQAESFSGWLEFETPWGLGVAIEGEDNVASRVAYSQGAVLYVYRDIRGWMGVAARAHTSVDLQQLYRDLRRVDPGADWYLHPSKRMLLCGTPKAPPRQPSRLSLQELIGLLRDDGLFFEQDDSLAQNAHGNV